MIILLNLIWLIPAMGVIWLAILICERIQKKIWDRRFKKAWDQALKQVLQDRKK